MGKTTGFLEYARLENPFRDESVRLGDFEELHQAQPADARRCQASRCMYCGVPFCQSDYGCPLHNLIPEWNDLLFHGFEREALDRLLETAPFPEFTGRVCPALCEKACNLADEGVTNRDNELYLIETGFEKGWIKPRIPRTRSGKRIAVVGSGPSGLAAADLLNRLGHGVTVFEKADRPGGLMMYGIPNMKLPKNVIGRRIRLMEAEGVRFLLETEAEPEELKNYDAVLLCGGARKPRTLSLDNMDVEGVYFAVSYLTEATKAVFSGKDAQINAKGKHVVVIGGGDTGNDCVGTSSRHGAKSVVQLEMMPKPPETRAENNPWPQWPRVLKTDYGQEEAIALFGKDPRIYQTTVKEFLKDESGKLKGAVLVKLRAERDENTGRLMMKQIEGSEYTVDCELVLIAAGFLGSESYVTSEFGVELDGRTNVAGLNGSHRTSVENVFTAGDMHSGQSLVVRAIRDGRDCAREVDESLMGYTNL